MIKIKTLLLLLLLFMITTAVLFVFQLLSTKTSAKRTNTIVLSTFKTPIGWGYKIDVDGRTIVYQPFVPVIETHTGFETDKIAKAAGTIVLKKMLKYENPTLTLAELKQAGVKIDKKLADAYKLID